MNKSKQSNNEYIKSQAIDFGEIDGVPYWIVPGPCEGLNGYVCFPQKPVKEPDYDGILAYVPVHGGITYAEHDAVGSVYGFDTAHCDSNKYPRMNPQWIAGQCAVMVRAIRLAEKLEDEYLLAEGNNERRAQICQKVRDVSPDQQLGMGAMLNLLSGQL